MSGLSRIQANTSFFSIRGDGLGERLRAILNIIALANLTGGRFYFSWPNRRGEAANFHATASQTEIFSEGYINQYIVDTNTVRRKKLPAITAIKGISEGSLSETEGYIVNTAHLKTQLSISDSDFQVDYKAAFNSIGYSDDIQKAIDAADKLKLACNVVALHLRAGDIIYGNFRFSNAFFPKLIPAYVVEKIIINAQARGNQVVIFGQDETLCRGLSHKYNLIYSQDVCNQDFNESQKAFFDIRLMSRCESIVAGSSGFAVISSWIGNGKIFSYEDVLDETEIQEAFKVFMSNIGTLEAEYITPLQLSYSIMHFVLKYADNFELEKKLSLIQRCKDLDPENTFLHLVESTYLYKLGKCDVAEKAMFGLFDENQKYNIYWLLNANRLRAYMSCLREISGMGSLMASNILLLCERKYCKKICLNNYNLILSNHDKQSLGYNLLEENLSSI